MDRVNGADDDATGARAFQVADPFDRSAESPSHRRREGGRKVAFESLPPQLESRDVPDGSPGRFPHVAEPLAACMGINETRGSTTRAGPQHRDSNKGRSAGWLVTRRQASRGETPRVRAARARMPKPQVVIFGGLVETGALSGAVESATWVVVQTSVRRRKVQVAEATQRHSFWIPRPPPGRRLLDSRVVPADVNRRRPSW